MARRLHGIWTKRPAAGRQRALLVVSELLENSVLEFLTIGLAMIGLFQFDGTVGVGERFLQPTGGGTLFGSLGSLTRGFGIGLDRSEPLGRLLPVRGFLAGSGPRQEGGLPCGDAREV